MSFRLPTLGFFLLLVLTACGQLASPTTTDITPTATSGGTVVAWGYNDDGQTTVPALPAGVSYTNVAGGRFHSLALRSDGRVIAWGYNYLGQTNVPALPEGSKYLGVAGGGFHSLAITAPNPKQTQTLSFTSVAPTDAIVGGSYTPSATATSGLSVTFGTSTPRSAPSLRAPYRSSQPVSASSPPTKRATPPTAQHRR